MQPGFRFCFLFLIIISCSILHAQNLSDRKLILANDFSDSSMLNKRKVSFGVSKSNSLIVKYNPVTLIFSGLMFTYQKWLSPQISADCLYSPSCSEYSKLLFREYGFLKGMFTSADRLMRCDRISATTLNPIAVNEQDGRIHEDVNRYRIRVK